MRYITLILTILLLTNCGKKNKEIEKKYIISHGDTLAVITINKIKYPFYDFDKVEHYKSNLTFEQEKYLRRTDTVGFKILMEKYPKEINDSIFYRKLIQNYSEMKVEPNLNSTISEIYSEKYGGEGLAFACDPFYRDILIFKKRNKIVGVSKVCFECGENWTIGSKRDVSLFGQNEDYEKLKKILYK
jgi:hypothetical protein